MIDDLETITAIAAAAEAADGAAPLDEATWLTLRHHPDRVRCWQRDRGFALVIGDELSLVVHPDGRGRGAATRLL
ncbi:MAG TPA: mycothiol synthase, partial [Nocardioides sp.]